MRAHPLNKNVSEALAVADPGEGPGRGALAPCLRVWMTAPLSGGLDLPLSCVTFCKLPLETQYCQYSRTFCMLVSKPIQMRAFGVTAPREYSIPLELIFFSFPVKHLITVCFLKVTVIAWVADFVTVEPPCTAISRKQPPPISDRQSKTPKPSQLEPYSRNL